MVAYGNVYSGLIVVFMHKVMVCEVDVEILNNMTHIHRDYPDYTLISKTCIIHNLLYVDHQFTEAEIITCAHRSINHTYQHNIFPGKASR